MWPKSAEAAVDASFCYNRVVKNTAFIAFLFLSFSASAQLLTEDTTTAEPFFHAKKFNSACYVGVDAEVTQVFKTQAGMNIGLNLNWVVNHRFVVSAKYHTLSSREDIQPIVEPFFSKPVYLTHHFAGLAFSYILFDKKKFSFQPEICAGWASAKFEWPQGSAIYQRQDWAAVIPAVYGIYNATKYFRLGAGLNYRAVLGPQFFGLRAMDLSGLSGVVFFRVGTF